MPWRARYSEEQLRRDGRRWTLWTASMAAAFGIPAAALLLIEPMTAPAALVFAGHGAGIAHLQARRGARAVVPIGGPGSVARGLSIPTEGVATPYPRRAEPEEMRADKAALGLLADLVGHEERELLAKTGLALHRGGLGVWLVGEEGALLVHSGGRRVDSWCVRVGEAGGLPAGDRVAHLLLALREDELGFATVANRNFSGSRRRVRRRMAASVRPALDRARELARRG